MASVYEQVYGLHQPPTTKEEVIDYYQRAYPGRGATGWKQQLVRDLSGVTGMKPKNLERRFDPSRIENPETRLAYQYETLGVMLPPLPPENGYHIFGTIWVRYSKDCVDREIDVTVVGEEANRLAAMASNEMIQAVANTYQSNDPEGNIDFRGPSWCAEPDLIVEPLEEE